MSEPFIGQISMVGFNFAPRGWAVCDGQLLPIASNSALFSILGTTYGGDGVTTFALPDLRGRGPLGVGQGPGLANRTLGENGGSDTVTLTVDQIPTHTHTAQATSGTGTDRDPRDRTWAAGTANRYATSASVNMDPTALASFGTSGPHENLPPYQVVNFVIALQGVFPPRA